MTYESEWKPPFSSPFENALSCDDDEVLDLGCVASHGFFHRDRKTGSYKIDTDSKPATGFLFRLISQLQLASTVPMIDVEAHASWLTD